MKYYMRTVPRYGSLKIPFDLLAALTAAKRPPAFGGATADIPTCIGWMIDVDLLVVVMSRRGVKRVAKALKGVSAQELVDAWIVEDQMLPF